MTDTKKYELVVVFDPGLNEDELRAQMERIGAVVREHGGTVGMQEIWGRRQLAYRIKKKEYGVYVVMTFDGDGFVSDLDRQLKINESVLRHLIVRKDKYAPDFVKRRSEEEEVGPLPVGGSEFDAPDLVDGRS